MWKEQKSDPLASAARDAIFCSSHIMTSYSVSKTEQTRAKSYLFVNWQSNVSIGQRSIAVSNSYRGGKETKICHRKFVVRI
jgi:hypothetical protein